MRLNSVSHPSSLEDRCQSFRPASSRGLHRTSANAALRVDRGLRIALTNIAGVVDVQFDQRRVAVEALRDHAERQCRPRRTDRGHGTRRTSGQPRPARSAPSPHFGSPHGAANPYCHVFVAVVSRNVSKRLAPVGVASWTSTTRLLHGDSVSQRTRRARSSRETQLMHGVDSSAGGNVAKWLTSIGPFSSS